MQIEYHPTGTCGTGRGHSELFIYTCMLYQKPVLTICVVDAAFATLKQIAQHRLMTQIDDTSECIILSHLCIMHCDMPKIQLTFGCFLPWWHSKQNIVPFSLGQSVHVTSWLHVYSKHAQDLIIHAIRLNI